MSPESDHDTADDFAPVSRAEWEAEAERALRGRPLASLDTTTAEGIIRSPLYTRELHGVDHDESGLPGAPPHTRGDSAAGTVLGWEIRQTHDAGRDGANAAVLRDLERGVTGIALAAAPDDVDALAAVLDGVYLDLAPVHLSPGSTADQRAALVGLAERQGVASSVLAGCLGADPIGRFAATGLNGDTLGDEVVAVATEAAGRATSHPGVATIAVDGSVAADSGASDAQELATVLATGVAWLRALTDAGVDVDAAGRALELTLTVGPDQFLSIAKLRAARTCWSRVLEASGAAEGGRPTRIHAVTASSMMTQRDPWVNMLRTTTACFSAAVGGADAITVQPFDAAVGASDEFGLRVARNTQLILHEETNAAGVIDPAGGSWYVEDLTRQLAREAWTRFQEIEANGGVIASLTDGSLQQRIAEEREARLADLATRRSPITGVSEFPDIAERRLTRDEANPTERASNMPLFRWAEPFEQLRDAADAARADRPMTVFLANLGPVAVHTARATFAKNLFEVGGVEALGNDGFYGPEAAAAAFTASGSRLACICSSDAVYAEQAADTARALVAAGAERVYLAGAPGEHAEEWRTAGVQAFVHLGCDVLATLTEAHELLGS